MSIDDGHTPRALISWGGWDGHEPEQSAHLASADLQEEGFEVELSDSLETYADLEKMGSLDLVVSCWTMATITSEQESGLLDAVQRGVGLAGWHGCLTDSFRQNVGYQFMVGGQWVAHPGDLVDYRVNIVASDDAIVSGLPDFDMRTEQYYMHMDPAVKVLATTTFTEDQAPWIDGVVMPVVWTKMFGQGRVFATTLGHHTSDLLVPESREILRRGMLWAGRRA